MNGEEIRFHKKMNLNYYFSYPDMLKTTKVSSSSQYMYKYNEFFLFKSMQSSNRTFNSILPYIQLQKTYKKKIYFAVLT